MNREAVARELVGVAELILAAAPPLYTWLDKFHQVQRRFSKMGAYDSEPSGVFADLMVAAMSGKPWKEPVSWQIYTSLPGWKGVERVLNREAKKVADALAKAPYSEQKALADYMGWWDFHGNPDR